MVRLKTKKILGGALVLALVVSGCAGRREKLDSSFETARLAIGDAKRNEAAQYAPNELIRAEQKLTLAEQEVRMDNRTNARRLAEQATIDARYAETRAQAERTQVAATESRATSDTLKGIR